VTVKAAISTARNFVFIGPPKNSPAQEELFKFIVGSQTLTSPTDAEPGHSAIANRA
jgi:hypothetical protein